MLSSAAPSQVRLAATGEPAPASPRLPESPPTSPRPSPSMQAPAGLQPRRNEVSPDPAHITNDRPRAASLRLEQQRAQALRRELADVLAFGSQRHPQLAGLASPAASEAMHTPETHFSEMDSASEVDSDSEVEEASVRRRHPGQRDHVVITIDTPLTPREQVEQALGRLSFAAPEGPLRDAQVALERVYINWAAGVAEKRHAIFGESAYQVSQDHTLTFAEAVVPALYDAGRQFITSSSRSPAQNATATALQPRFDVVNDVRINRGELDNQTSSAAASGAVGGATAYVMDATLLKAIAKRAKIANLPKLEAVDLKALVPDPGPVQLRVVDGRKEYWRPAATPGGDIETGDGAAHGRLSLAELKDSAALRRSHLERGQEALESSGWGSLAQPLLTGGFNTLRRMAMSAKALTKPWPVFGGSIIASGSAGATAKFTLAMLKPLANTMVDDLVGGQQRMSLFATKLPDPSKAPARLSDIGALPGHVKAATVEAASLLAHLLAGPWREGSSVGRTMDAVIARIDDASRFIAANTMVSLIANATGPFVARALRGDSPGPLPGEPQHSHAYKLQQAVSSFTNDFSWQTARKAIKGGTLDIEGPMERWQARNADPSVSTRHRPDL